MAWLITSDWHLNPGNEIPDFKKDYPDVTDIILVGDIINILPLGMKKWRTEKGETTIKSIANLAKRTSVYYLFGNHEGRMSWLKSLFKDYNEINISRDFKINNNGEKWWIEHGHRYTEWRFLRLFADELVEWLTSNIIIRKLWYYLCVKLGWLPGQYIKQAPEDRNKKEKYSNITLAYWILVMRASRKKGMSYIVGHSHTRVNIDTEFAKVIDLGTRKVIII